MPIFPPYARTTPTTGSSTAQFARIIGCVEYEHILRAAWHFYHLWTTLAIGPPFELTFALIRLKEHSSLLLTVVHADRLERSKETKKQRNTPLPSISTPSHVAMARGGSVHRSETRCSVSWRSLDIHFPFPGCNTACSLAFTFFGRKPEKPNAGGSGLCLAAYMISRVMLAAIFG